MNTKKAASGFRHFLDKRKVDRTNESRQGDSEDTGGKAV